jgi:hypothetical protein
LVDLSETYRHAAVARRITQRLQSMIYASMPDSLLSSGAGLFSELKSLDAHHLAQLTKVVGRFEGAFSSIALERARFPRRFALVFQGGVPFSGLLAPLVQRKIVRNPEQRSTDRHLVSVAWRVNNHYTGRYQAGARRVMRLRPSPHNSPMGADQRQRKVNRRRTEENSPKFPPGNENRRVSGCDVLAYLERDQIRAANRQRTGFNIRPRYYLVHQVTQCLIVSMVGALNVERANDCERSFTPPIGKTWSNVDRSFYAF